jgi:NTE family protein
MEWIEEADGVFRGGGVKGIGLAGALAGFAEHPTKPVKKWVNVAGASAGAIIACYLALGHSADEMLQLMHDTDFSEFADFPGGNMFGGAINLVTHHGLAHGHAFEEWFDRELGGATFARVRKEPVPGAGVAAAGGRDWHLKLIAVDVTNRNLLVLPDDLVNYKLPGTNEPIDPDAFKISKAARMSMSIPYFFEPVILEHVNTGPSVIIDGGTLSNFPVWLFDVDPSTAGRPPARPTFGFTLKGGKGVGPGGLGPLEKLVPWGIDLAFDIFHTAEQAWDKRFVTHSTRVRTLEVDAADVATTDFKLSDEKQQLLIGNGRTAARDFLDKFELSDYMNTYHAGTAAG